MQDILPCISDSSGKSARFHGSPDIFLVFSLFAGAAVHTHIHLAAGAGADDVLVLNSDHTHRRLHIFPFHFSTSFLPL